MKKEVLHKMINLLLSNEEFVILDIETSGYSPQKGSKIIEIGAVVIKNGEIIETYQQLINPEIKIPTKIIELTGIDNEMVLNENTYGKVLNEFYDKIIKNRVLVMHDARFDWDRHLVYFFNTLGIFPDNQVIDTLILAKDVFDKLEYHNLESLYSELNLANKPSHRALIDVMTTKELLLILKKHYAANALNYFVNTSFLLVNPQTEYAKRRLSIDYLNMKVKKIKYWEKSINKKLKHQRIYVTFNFGDVYFDIASQIWFLKELREGYEGMNIDFKKVESKVLSILNLENREQLCTFRN